MKVLIMSDELYPFYWMPKVEHFATEIEMDEDTHKRITEAMKEFDEVQKIMKDLI